MPDTGIDALDLVRASGGADDRPALIGLDGQRVSYGRLDEAVDAVADQLGGIRRLVLVEATATTGAIVGYLGARRAGCPVLLAGGDGPLARTLLDRYDPDVVLGAADPTALLPAVVERRPGTVHELHPDLALLLSTSGSTGSPKLVRLSSRNVTSNALAIAEYLRLTPDDVTQTSLPMHYCYGLSVLHSHLVAGAAVVLSDRSVADACFWRSFTEHGATNFAGVPHTFDLLDRLGFASMELPSLRFVTQAGGRMPPQQVRRFAELADADGWELFVMYGQTEATARMAYLPPDRARSHPASIGRAIPGGELRLEPVEGLLVEDGVGELVYRGPNVMLGYAEHPADLAHGRTDDELRTGDLARCDADGLFEVVGRRSRFLKLFGLRVDLDQVEASLAAGAVTAWAAGDDDGLVVAVAGADAVDRARRAISNATGLPAMAIAVHAVRDAPRLPSGKVDQRALLDLRGAGAAPDQAPAPADVGDELRRLYARTLDLDAGSIGDSDTFVGLGGDSLSYVELSVRLEAILGHLPAQWHVLPVGELVARPATTSSRHPQVETSVVLRALAIVLVVCSHTDLVELRGGAHVLLAVTGFNFARFQLLAVRAGGGVQQLWASIGRVALPSAIWIGLVVLATDELRLANVLLVNGVVGAEGGQGLWKYWYVEVAVHLLAVVALLLGCRWVRRLERAGPLCFAWGVLGLALLLRSELLPLPDGGYPWFQAHNTFWLFAIGWVAERSRSTGSRVLLSVVTAAAVAGTFPSTQRQVVVLLGALALLWWPTMRVPRPWNRALGVVASASLFIYLLHWQVLDLTEDRLGPLVSAVLAVVVGLAGSAAWSALSGRAALMLRRLRAPRRVAAGEDRRTARSAG